MGRPRVYNVGDVYRTNQGYDVKVIDVDTGNKSTVKIKFMDDYGAELVVIAGHLKDGVIKNPYHPSVYNVGYLGLMPDGSRCYTGTSAKHTREYKVWYGMMRRCYSGEEHFKTYRNVTVCDRWLCFANFLEDVTKIDGYDEWIKREQYYELDKDIKQQGVENKVYSLETVAFVPKAENKREVAYRTIANKNN